ncbi:multiprotein-bridging factor 1 family protein [Kitasatospora sp. NPDC096147]|uniref:helix-turn-helix domain-containing protein n=1 Tax=Kitasatospora sp. NPDC096147 TaxID=3364093 RepID=UPI00381E9E62
MASRGLSNRALASQAGISDMAIGRILKGLVLPDIGTVSRLEAVLEADLYPAGLWKQLDRS